MRNQDRQKAIPEESGLRMVVRRSMFVVKSSHSRDECINRIFASYVQLLDTLIFILLSTQSLVSILSISIH